MNKAVIVLALAACVNAGGVYLDHHVGATAEQTVRGYGGLSSISHQAKNVNSAFSAASAYKTKVTNNALLAAPVAHAVAAPAYHAHPAYAHGPVAHAIAPAAYAAPLAHHVAPAYHAHAHPAYAPVAAPAYHHPIARALPVAAPVAKAGLLGVAYSPVVPGVATLTFDGFGVHYGY